MGGLARRASYLEEARKKYPNLLLLDAGDAFIGTSLQSRLKAQTMVSGMNFMGYDALTLGENELFLGPDFLGEVASEAQFPLLSANLPAQGLAKPYVVKSLGNLRVGIVGVVAAALVNQGSPTTGHLADLSVKDELTTLKILVPKLRQEVNLVVVLAHVGMHGAQTLAREVPGIDVIVVGHGGTLSTHPTRVKDTILVQGGSEGKQVGVLYLQLDTQGRVTKAEGTSANLTAKVPDHPAMVGLMEAYREQLKQREAALVAEIPAKPPLIGKGYVGASACQSCHTAPDAQWKGTEHAKALEALGEDGRQDPDCWSCHSTGLGYLGGFRGPQNTPQLAGVQCESCHGAGAEHLAAPAKGYGAVSEATCLACHTQKTSPRFQFSPYRSRILHQ